MAKTAHTAHKRTDDQREHGAPGYVRETAYPNRADRRDLIRKARRAAKKVS